MKIKKVIKKDVYGVKLVFEEKGMELGRAFLYILKNDLHKRPFALLEDVFVQQDQRGRGLGSKLIVAAIAEAKKHKCYKIIATSRNSKKELHGYYKKFGFKLHGVELRINFK
jgi:GNAT superfamily N-acetyltransferase